MSKLRQRLAAEQTTLLLDGCGRVLARGGVLSPALGDPALGEDLLATLGERGAAGLSDLRRDLERCLGGEAERTAGQGAGLAWSLQRLEGAGGASVLLELSPLVAGPTHEDDAELFRRIFERSIDGVGVLDARDGTYLLQNDAHRELVGYSDRELTGQTPAIHLHPDDATAVLQALQAEGTFRGEVRSTARDGTARWIELAAFTVQDEAGAPRYMVGIKRDATPRRRAEEAGRLRQGLRETVHSLLTWSRSDLALRAQLQGALMELLLVPWLELSPYGAVFLTEPDGADPEVLLRAAATNFSPEVDRLRWSAGRATTLAGEPVPDPQPERLLWAPLELGEQLQGLLVVRSRGEPSPLQRHSLGALAGALAGMVARRRALDALEESQRRFSELATSIPGVVYQYELRPDGSASFPLVSDSAEALLGLSPALIQADASLAFQRIHPDDLPGLYESIRVSAEQLTTWTYEYRHLLPSGEQRWHRGVSNPRRLANGAVRWSGVIVDITDRHEGEQELRLAKEAAEAATRAKSRFLANVSHELRTPMNAVIGMAELLLGTALDGSQLEYAETIRASADSLLLLIDDLLDVTRVEQDRLELELAPCDPRALVEGALAELAERAARKGLALASIFEGPVPGRVVADRGRLRQVLVNLLSNAVKFTAAGEVVVAMRATPRPGSERGLLLELSVRDTGMGIAAERMHLLFEPFRQLEDEPQEGTGLGLAICSGLVGLMGGRIWCESEPGRGSVFSFTCPVEPDGAHEPQRPGSGALPRLRAREVALVVGNEAERRMLEQQCERWGLHAHPCADLAAAAPLLQEPEPAVELLLLDASPEHLAALERAPCAVPVALLLTVRQAAPTPAQAEALGVVGNLRKPVRLEALLALFGEQLAASAPRPGTPPPAALAASLPLRVLVVEDHRLNQRVVTHQLAHLGYRAALAGDGLEAVRLVEQEPFDLVLMDVQMPRLNGLEATRRIRELLRPGPRIVAMTASASAEDRRACLRAGMDAYLAKPVRLGALEAVLEELFRDPPALDLEHLERLQAAGGARHPRLVEELVQVFLEDAPELFAEVQHAPAGPALARATHALRGACLNLGGAEVARVCADLERFAGRGELRAQLQAQVERELERMLAQLRARR
ncbi:MAG: response regulator [Planctomycetota bacterium]